jgi:DNA polymerase IIIc chi subunit
MRFVANEQEKKVAFYSSESDFLSVSIKLMEKFYQMSQNALVLCSNPDEVSLFDAKLWTYSQLSFIPHGSKHSIPPEDVRFCKVWISTDITLSNNPTCLIHNGRLLNNNDVSRFNIIADVFGKELINDMPVRSNFYKSSGFNDIKLWEQKDGSWTQGKIEKKS